MNLRPLGLLLLIISTVSLFGFYFILPSFQKYLTVQDDGKSLVTPPIVELSDQQTIGSIPERGDLIEFEGVKGILREGPIADGLVKSKKLRIVDASGETILYYEHLNSDEGHIEMISYPQRGEDGMVLIRINGEEVNELLGSDW